MSLAILPLSLISAPAKKKSVTFFIPKVRVMIEALPCLSGVRPETPASIHWSQPNNPDRSPTWLEAEILAISFVFLWRGMFTTSGAKMNKQTAEGGFLTWARTFRAWAGTRYRAVSSSKQSNIFHATSILRTFGHGPPGPCSCLLLESGTIFYFFIFMSGTKCGPWFNLCGS